MKKVLILFFLLLVGISTNAQDVFSATYYTDNGKKLYKLETPRYFTFNQQSIDRTEFSIIENNVTLLNGYLTKSVILKTETINGLTTESRKITVVDKNSSLQEYEFLFTVIVDALTNRVDKFIITSIVNESTKRSYLGSGI